MTATKMYTSRPIAPSAGDCYFDEATGHGYIWQGIAWVQFSGSPIPEPSFMPPTQAQLDKHPSLKAAWEDLLVIKKLLGV